MLTIKIAFNDKTEAKVAFLKGYPWLEMYNEDYYKERKKALGLKASCGAREVPFIAFYHDGELVKALYNEANECDVTHVNEFLAEYVKEHAHKGWITVQKVEGVNNELIPVGRIYSGHTDTFMEGVSCRISPPTHWFRSSNVTSIDWEKGEFKTLNSTYKFEFTPDNELDDSLK